MRNDECTILISTRLSYVQRYRRSKDGWTQTCPDGTVRRLTAEQLLSHILPPLAGVSPANVIVEPDKRKRKTVRKRKSYLEPR